jgi:integrase
VSPAGKRAAPHRGSERVLPTGTVQIQVSLGGQRRTVYGPTLTAAREALALLVADYHRGLTGKDARAERQTLSTWLRKWLDGRRGTVVPSTWAMYRVCVEGRLIPLLGGITLRDLEPSAVGRAYARLQRPPYRLGPSTIHKAHVTLLQALQEAQRDGIVARNVAQGIKLPKVPRTGARALTPDEVGRLLRGAAEAHRPLWTVALHTGLRTGELLGLCWGDVVLDPKPGRPPSLTVQRVAADGEDGQGSTPVLRDEPKNRPSVRTVRLSAEAVAALRAQRTAQLAARLRAVRWEDAGKEHGGLVFASARGTPRLRTNVRREFVADAAAAGIALPPRSALHCLRHSFASALLAEGRPTTEVAYLMGHSSSATTLRVYGHWVKNDLSAASEALSRHYGSGRG